MGQELNYLHLGDILLPFLHEKHQSKEFSYGYHLFFLFLGSNAGSILIICTCMTSWVGQSVLKISANLNYSLTVTPSSNHSSDPFVLWRKDISSGLSAFIYYSRNENGKFCKSWRLIYACTQHLSFKKIGPSQQNRTSPTFLQECSCNSLTRTTKASPSVRYVAQFF